MLTVRDEDGALQTLRVTEEHPFFVRFGGWTPAKSLEAGDTVLGAEGTLAVVANEYEAHPQGVAVYNLEVEQAHTYFVLAEGANDVAAVWVHNECDAAYEQMMDELQADAIRQQPKSTRTLAGWLSNSPDLLSETREWHTNRPNWWSIDPDTTPVFYGGRAEVDRIRAMPGERPGHHRHGLALGGPAGQKLTPTGDTISGGVNKTHARVTGLQRRVINAIRGQQ